MNVLIFLVPASLCLAVLALAAFVWTIKSGQYDDLSGDAGRMVADSDPSQEPELESARDRVRPD